MKNEHDESKKLIVGLLIGGVIAAGALYSIYAVRNRKTPLLKKIGQTISDVGQMLENCNIQSGDDVIKHIEKKVPKGEDIASNLSDWVEAGVSLWKILKKG